MVSEVRWESRTKPWFKEQNPSLKPSPAASDQRVHFYTLHSAASKHRRQSFLSMMQCVPRLGLWLGCELVGINILELKFVSLLYLYFLDKVQDSIWEDEGQVHPSSRYANPHQSQEGLLECQWCTLPVLLSPLVVGTAAVEVPKKQDITVTAIVPRPGPQHGSWKQQKH